MLTILLLCSAAYPDPDNMTLTVRSSPASVYQTMHAIDSSILSLPTEFITLAHAPYLTDIYVTLRTGSQLEHYRLERSGNLWDERSSRRLVLHKAAAAKLLQKASMLRRQHFGKIIDWEEAQRIITRKAVFSIKDLESGLTFRVQRRAGSAHADVQPLTKEDTKIMKQIFKGKWSWDRKAVLAGSNNNWIAASMNGMPHGGDGIPDNDFSGHFCVHFLNSTTHRSDEPDPDHQLMVLKAGGNLRAYFNAASPHTLVQNLVGAVNLHDDELIRLILEGTPRDTEAQLLRAFSSIDSIRMIKTRETEYSDDTLFSSVAMKAMLRYKDRKKQRIELRFMLDRQFVHSPWRIQDLVVINGTKETPIEKYSE
ncbi:hypothetical protein K0T92_04540 [Paenibacillus oenotherae]|uniref:DUF4340 domain-containing protein n=1 Tax=Paenibacillus oenotherae TaxID=1435645 RepID=A0ABS7D282_9BACL|nr:hypothetical protein [Paenibacillus oenotherae]MBW7474000.1 hypothetical protein [Paenibacillus oenotherae]